MIHMEYRMGQCLHSRGPPACSLPCHESYFRRSSSMFVFNYLVLRSLQRPVLILFSGRDYDYQTLNLTFAVNVVKFGLIIRIFPKILKPCVVPSIRVPLSLKPTLVLCHGCYRTFPPRFDRRLSLSDLWSRNGLQRWRSMERTGRISRFVRPLHLVSISLHG